MSFVDTVQLMDPWKNPNGSVLVTMYKGLICLAAVCLLTVTYVQIRSSGSTPIVITTGRTNEFHYDVEFNPTESPTRPTPEPQTTTPEQSTTELYTTVDPFARTGRQCYKEADFDPKLIEMLDDVLLSDNPVPNDSAHIFFHETSCLNGVVKLSARQACAIESAAAKHPNSSVYLLYASPVGFERDQDHPALFQALDNYANIRMRTLDLSTYAVGTPAEDFLSKTNLFDSKHAPVDLADLLRLITLYKFGGTHIDLDFIVMQPLTDLGVNYAGLRASVSNETLPTLSGALLNLEVSGLGRVFAEKSVRQFVDTYSADTWEQLGGGNVLSEAVNKVCRTSDVRACTIFAAQPADRFSPIAADAWSVLFAVENATEIQASIKDSKAVHFWNQLSSNTPVRVGGGSVYDALAAEHCPRVYETLNGQESF